MKEGSRYRLLEHASMRTDETRPDLADFALVPTVPSGMRRITISVKRAWIVEPPIVSCFQPQPGDTIVGCHSRSSPAPVADILALALRSLAWDTGGYPEKWRRLDRADHVVRRIPLQILRAELVALSGGALEFLCADLQPAIHEIRQLTDLVVDVEPYRAPSICKPKGRVLGFVGKIERHVVPAPERTEHTAQIIAFPSSRGFAPFRPLPLPRWPRRRSRCSPSLATTTAGRAFASNAADQIRVIAIRIRYLGDRRST